MGLATINAFGSQAERHPLKDKNLTDDVFFGLAMQNEDFCKEILSIILNKDVVEIEYVHTQETLQNLPGYKSIRLDAFVRLEDGSLYNVEMQQLNNDDMPKRARYYQGLMDVSTLFSGKRTKYKELPKSMIIFITDFDVFGKGRYQYTFTERCKEDSSLELGDETTKIFLNLTGYRKDETPDELIELLQYIKCTNRRNVTSRLDDLAQVVEMLKGNKRMEREYMNYEAYALEHKDEWEAAAQAKGEIKALIQLVHDGVLTKDIAAKNLNMSIAEVESLVEEYKRTGSLKL